jgi:hypothetical protein
MMHRSGKVRQDLLAGTPDAHCRGCGLRIAVTPAALQTKVRELLEKVQVPDEFDPILYLEANPRLREANVDPVEHFLRHGRFEGRQLNLTGRDQTR